MQTPFTVSSMPPSTAETGQANAFAAHPAPTATSTGDTGQLFSADAQGALAQLIQTAADQYRRQAEQAGRSAEATRALQSRNAHD